MKIERAIPSQAEILTRIAVSAKSYWNYPPHWIEIWLPQLTILGEYITANETWMATMDDKPIGFYALSNGDEVQLDHLWVLPEFIGQGIGAKLFNHAIERGHLRGVKKLTIEADPNAFGFYQKMGAYKVGEQRGEVDGQPRILLLMEIKL